MVPGLSQLQTLAACAVVALVVGSVQQVRVVNMRAEAEALRADLAAARADAIAAARKTEEGWRARVDEIAERYEKEKADAEEAHARVVAGLESGAVRLRAHWQGCLAAGDLSAAAAAAARADDAARLRAEGAGDLVRLGAQCDARIRGLQTIVTTYTHN